MNIKSKDAVFGIRTRDRRMVSANGSRGLPMADLHSVCTFETDARRSNLSNKQSEVQN